MDAEAVKGIVWNLSQSIFCIVLLLVGAYFAQGLLVKGQPFKESIQIVGIVLALPAFVLMAMYDRMSRETIGVIAAGLIGFAVGKIG
jgi:hypothetical protein